MDISNLTEADAEQQPRLPLKSDTDYHYLDQYSPAGVAGYNHTNNETTGIQKQYTAWTIDDPVPRNQVVFMENILQSMDIDRTRMSTPAPDNVPQEMSEESSPPEYPLEVNVTVATNTESKERQKHYTEWSINDPVPNDRVVFMENILQAITTEPGQLQPETPEVSSALKNHPEVDVRPVREAKRRHNYKKANAKGFQ